MSTRYSFQMESQERRHPLPRKIIIGQQDTETINHVGCPAVTSACSNRTAYGAPDAPVMATTSGSVALIASLTR